MRIRGRGKPLKAASRHLGGGASATGARTCEGPERGRAPGLGRSSEDASAQRTDCTASIMAVARSFSGFMASFMAADMISVALFISDT